MLNNEIKEKLILKLLDIEETGNLPEKDDSYGHFRGKVTFHELTTVGIIDCVEEKWR